MEITNETFKLILDKVDPLERDVALNKEKIYENNYPSNR